MSLNYIVDKVYSKFKEKGGTTSFPDSLKTVLTLAKTDSNINSLKRLAYLLATAKIESDYSLQRWEADYLCGSTGVAYNGKPCQRALDYYRSSQGNKLNYYTLGLDSKGLPYFGRGLIQLTGKSNYETYGKILGIDLVGNADLALVPKNSYKIATSYFKKRGTFDWIDKNNLTEARRTVNSGLRGVNEINAAYMFWLDVFKESQVTTANGKLDSKALLVLSLAALALGSASIILAFTKYGKRK